jgi:hypothetical protein
MGFQTFLIPFLFEAWEQMLKLTSFKRQEINLVFKIKVFVGSKIWYFNKFYLFQIFQKFGLLHPHTLHSSRRRKRGERHDTMRARARRWEQEG